MAALAPTPTPLAPTSSNTPFPWALGKVQKDVPTRPSHGNRSHSGSTSSTDSNRIKIIDLTQHEALMKKNMAYQERYLSSEEDLSPLDDELSDVGSFKSFDFESLSEEDEQLETTDGETEQETEEDDIERAVSAYADEPRGTWQKKQELAATLISIVYSGRPHVVDITPTPTASPTRTQRPAEEFTFTHGRNWGARPRPMLQHSRVATLSGHEFVETVSSPPPPMPMPPTSSWSSTKTSDADQASVVSSERRHSSVYSVASPPSPHFFNPLRRNSIVVDNNAPPAVHTVLPAPSGGESKPRHSRMKSLSRMGLFGSGSKKKDRKDASGHDSLPSLMTSASMMQLSDTLPPTQHTQRPQPPTYQPTSGLARSATTTTFAPPPFIRPQGRLVARGAGERADPAWSSMLGPVHTPTHVRPYDSYGDDELSEDDFMRGRDPAMTTKLRKRRSILGLNY